MLRHMRRKRITKFRSALKALPYPSWKRKIYILFPMRWVSNVDISLFYLIEIVLLKDQKRNLGPFKKFLPRSQFLKTNDPCRLTSLYKIILIQYPADHVGGKEVSWWGVKLATGLSWKLLLQTREKAVMGKHATWKNIAHFSMISSLCQSQIDSLVGLGAERNVSIPVTQTEVFSFAQREKQGTRFAQEVCR